MSVFACVCLRVVVGSIDSDNRYEDFYFAF